ATRPLLQSALLPTLAYVAGPHEMQYFAQLKELFTLFKLPMPWVVPRFSTTFIPFQPSLWLDKLNLTPWAPLPNSWQKISFFQQMQIPFIQKRLKELEIPFYALHYLNNL